MRSILMLLLSGIPQEGLWSYIDIYDLAEAIVMVSAVCVVSVIYSNRAYNNNDGLIMRGCLHALRL